MKEIAAYINARELTSLRRYLLSINGFRYLNQTKLTVEPDAGVWFGVDESSNLVDINRDYATDETINKNEAVIAKLLRERNDLLTNSNHNYELGNWDTAKSEFLKADRLEDEASKHLNIDPLDIRFLGGNLTSSIGHTSFGFSLRAKMTALSSNPVKRYWILPHSDSNYTYLKYWESKFHTLDISPRKLEALQQNFWFLQESISSVRTSETESMDLISAHNYYSLEWEKQSRPPLLYLSDYHNEEGMKFLRQNLGLKNGDWFVTVHVRDEVFSKPDYGRNANILSYLAAFDYIFDQGGYVVRIGGNNSRKLPKIPKLFDYAHFPQKSRMMDIFLLAKAKFMVATTSGPIGVASSFGTPILWTNAPDIGKAVFHPKALLIPKLIFNKSDKIISMSEMLSTPLGYTDSQIHKINGFENNFQGYKWRDNSETEIVDGVREMISGKFKDIDPKQRDFISILESYGNSGSTKIANSFLRQWENIMYN